ncbi:MAG: hypothetical protein ACXWJZ_16460 [Burkholderiaceae bacterium]
MLTLHKNFKSTVILFATTGLLGCASIGHDDHPQKFYDAAIADAAIVSPEKIMPLLPIPAGPSVTVVSWVTENRLPCRADESQCAFTTGADRIWVTLSGEVQSLCRSWNLSGDPLRRRLEQLLGLPMDPPPQYRKAKFVIMDIPQGRLERACLGVNDSDAAHPQCTLDVQASTSAELRQYVQQQMAGSYILRNPKGPGYPFTRLGYTYDWSPIAKAPNHYGASEFLLMPVTTAKVAAQIATDDYCK